jgi:hypothetical protein
LGIDAGLAVEVQRHVEVAGMERAIEWPGGLDLLIDREIQPTSTASADDGLWLVDTSVAQREREIRHARFRQEPPGLYTRLVDVANSRLAARLCFARCKGVRENDAGPWS